MLQLVNLSNFSLDNEMLLQNKKEMLEDFLAEHDLDGIEFMLCEPWNQALHPSRFIKGVHLEFWSAWLDFWCEDKLALMKQFNTDVAIARLYGGLKREDWLQRYRENILASVQTGAQYLVFHVSHARGCEIYDWKFSATNREVVESAIEVVNFLAKDIPENVSLLFENLWWPGLTMLDKELVALLMEKVEHKKIGFMLDTGHLMNTNQELKSEDEAVDYILKTVKNLGVYKSCIKGLHLHRSLSGEYVKRMQQKPRYNNPTPGEIMEHVLKVDEHLPFTTKRVKEIIEFVRPEILVHEFTQMSLEDWHKKVATQMNALK